MSHLIVETGSIIAGANSYVDVAYADAYFTARGDSVWAALPGGSPQSPVKEAALIKGADYLQQKYRLKWSGARMDALQALDWPRRGVAIPDFFDPFYKNAFVPPDFQNTLFVDTATVPDTIKQAQCILARQCLDASGALTVELQPPLGRVTQSERVGSIAVSYMPTAAGSRQTTIYWAVQQVIQWALRKDSSNSAPVIRA